MRKMIIIPLLLTLLVTACGSKSGGNPTGASGAGSLPQLTQLLIGIMKLDGTKDEVTQEQAAELLPMWQVYGQLTSSDTAAQAEIDGLTRQIGDTITASQRKAIEAMKLTQQDMFAFMQDQDIGMAAAGSSGRPSNGSSSGQGGGGFPGGGPSGAMPPGGGPGGMPDMGGGMTGGPTVSQIPSATQQARAGNINRVPQALLDALIQYLQKKAGS